METPLGRARVVRDYSRPGDIVCDPTAGRGMTLAAAAIEGRRAVGAEMNEDNCRKATRRLAAAFTPCFGFPHAVNGQVFADWDHAMRRSWWRDRLHATHDGAASSS